MLELLFAILLLVVFGKLLVFAFKATWGISKIIVTVILFPLFLIGLVVEGLVSIALPILIVFGIISMFTSKA